jgi:hypothetical protein
MCACAYVCVCVWREGSDVNIVTVGMCVMCVYDELVQVRLSLRVYVYVCV